MPKDKNQAKNKSRFEVRGGVINEFDFHQNQRALAEEEQNRFARQEEERRLREGEAEAAATAPQTEGEHVQQLMAEAHEKVQRRRESKPGASRPTARSSAGAKRDANSSAKSAVKKGGAKKRVPVKASGKKG